MYVVTTYSGTKHYLDTDNYTVRRESDRHLSKKDGVDTKFETMTVVPYPEGDTLYFSFPDGLYVHTSLVRSITLDGVEVDSIVFAGVPRLVRKYEGT